MNIDSVDLFCVTGSLAEVWIFELFQYRYKSDSYTFYFILFISIASCFVRNTFLRNSKEQFVEIMGGYDREFNIYRFLLV